MNPGAALRIFALAAVIAGSAHGGGIYWTNRGASLVERSGYDGVGRTTVFASAGTNVRGIALDLTGNRIFYADNGGDTLYRMNLDGTSRVAILSTAAAPGSGASFPADLRLNLAGGHLYYCDRDRNFIRRINLDGTGGITATASGTQPYYLDLDLAAGKIYWGDFDGVTANTGNVFRSNLNGTGTETIVTGTLETRAVCLDKAGGMLYWVNRNAGKIQRCALSALPVNAASSPAVQTIYQGLDTPHGMVLDVEAGKVYWVDTGTNLVGGAGAQAVSRGDMDGSGAQEILVNLGSEPWDIDIDPRCANYAEWVARFFPRTPGAAALATADAEGDALINAAEYALGRHPLRRDASAAPETLTVIDAGTPYPGIRFTRRAGVADVAALPQHSTDLAVWWDETQPGPAKLTVVSVEALPGGLEKVTARSTRPQLPAAPQYFRVRVVMP